MGSGTSKKVTPVGGDADKIFKQVDQNKDGKLSVTELVDAAAKYGKDAQKEWPEAKIKATIRKHDANGDGLLDKKEWKAALTALAKEGATDKSAKGAGQGSTSVDEAAKLDRLHAGRASENTKKSLTKERLRSIFVSYDADRDGELSFKEFAAMLQRAASFRTQHFLVG